MMTSPAGSKGSAPFPPDSCSRNGLHNTHTMMYVRRQLWITIMHALTYEDVMAQYQSSLPDRVDIGTDIHSVVVHQRAR